MGAKEEYEVAARFNLNAPPAIKALNAISDRMRGIGDRLKSANAGLGGMVGKLVAVGGTYLGLSMVARVLKSLAVGTLAASADTEKMAVSLAAVYSAVEKITFKEALSDAGKLRKQLEFMAIESVATTSELFEIFQGIYGPLRRAGLGVEQILKLTQDTAAAGAALGVDFQQIRRDISMMARGVAGVDVKTFSLLQSMGLIVETTEQWNKMKPEKRAARLMEALGKMGGEASAAYGKTWAGLSSTFKDLMENFRKVFGTAVFERMKGTLERINKYLLTNRVLIENNLRAMGERVAEVFDHILTRGAAMYANFVANLDSIKARAGEIYAKYLELKPILVEGLKVAAALQVASFAVGTVGPIIGMLVSAISALPVVVGGLMTAAGALATLIAKIQVIAVIFSSLGAGAGFAAIGASISAAFAAVAAALAPILLVVAAIVAVVLAIMKYKDLLLSALKPLISSIVSIGKQLWQILKDLWAAIAPVLAVLGGVVLVTVIAGLRVLAWLIDNVVLPPFRLMAKITRWLVETIIHPLGRALEHVLKFMVGWMRELGEDLEVLVEAVRSVIKVIDELIGAIGGAIGDAVSWIGDKLKGDEDEKPGSGGRLNTPEKRAMFRNALGLERQAIAGMANANAKATTARIKAIMDDVKRKQLDGELIGGKAPLDRPTVVNDFRGSKIEVKQEFRDAAPDRVWVSMREAFEREAMSRTQSGFANALSR